MAIKNKQVDTQGREKQAAAVLINFIVNNCVQQCAKIGMIDNCVQRVQCVQCVQLERTKLCNMVGEKTD